MQLDNERSTIDFKGKTTLTLVYQLRGIIAATCNENVVELEPMIVQQYSAILKNII